MYIVLDTETTGLPTRDPKTRTSSYKNLECYKNCRIVSIAWQLNKDDGAMVSDTKIVIRPDGFVIPADSTVFHGISHDFALETGQDFDNVMRLLAEDLEPCDAIVCHNADFDINVILAELHRRNEENPNARYRSLIDTISAKEIRCTMLMGKTYFGLGKWPKLVDLYKRLFKVEMVGNHDALCDVQACADIYTKMMKNEGRVAINS